MELKLSKKEFKYLQLALFNGKPCSSGCLIEKMEKSNKDCDECEFKNFINKIIYMED